MNNYVLKNMDTIPEDQTEDTGAQQMGIESKLVVAINVVQVLFVHHQRFFVMISGVVLAISHSILDIWLI